MRSALTRIFLVVFLLLTALAAADIAYPGQAAAQSKWSPFFISPERCTTANQTNCVPYDAILTPVSENGKRETVDDFTAECTYPTNGRNGRLASSIGIKRGTPIDEGVINLVSVKLSAIANDRALEDIPGLSDDPVYVALSEIAAEYRAKESGDQPTPAQLQRLLKAKLAADDSGDEVPAALGAFPYKKGDFRTKVKQNQLRMELYAQAARYLRSGDIMDKRKAVLFPLEATGRTTDELFTHLKGCGLAGKISVRGPGGIGDLMDEPLTWIARAVFVIPGNLATSIYNWAGPVSFKTLFFTPHVERSETIFNTIFSDNADTRQQGFSDAKLTDSAKQDEGAWVPFALSLRWLASGVMMLFLMIAAVVFMVRGPASRTFNVFTIIPRILLATLLLLSIPYIFGAAVTISNYANQMLFSDNALSSCIGGASDCSVFSEMSLIIAAGGEIDPSLFQINNVVTFVVLLVLAILLLFFVAFAIARGLLLILLIVVAPLACFAILADRFRGMLNLYLRAAIVVIFSPLVLGVILKVGISMIQALGLSTTSTGLLAATGDSLLRILAQILLIATFLLMYWSIKIMFGWLRAAAAPSAAGAAGGYARVKGMALGRPSAFRTQQSSSGDVTDLVGSGGGTGRSELATDARRVGRAAGWSAEKTLGPVSDAMTRGRGAIAGVLGRGAADPAPPPPPPITGDESARDPGGAPSQPTASFGAPVDAGTATGAGADIASSSSSVPQRPAMHDRAHDPAADEVSEAAMPAAAGHTITQTPSGLLVATSHAFGSTRGGAATGAGATGAIGAVVGADLERDRDAMTSQAPPSPTVAQAPRSRTRKNPAPAAPAPAPVEHEVAATAEPDEPVIAKGADTRRSRFSSGS